MGAGQAISGEHDWDGDLNAEPTGNWPGLESMHCDHCGRVSEKLRRCARCRGAFFCDRQCQQAGWPRHAAACGMRYEAADRPPSNPPSGPSSPRELGAATAAFREGLSAFRTQRFRESLASAEEAALAAAGEELWELRVEALRLQGQCLEQLSDLPQAKAVLAEALVESRARLQGSAATKAEANVLLRLAAVATRSSSLGIAVQYQRKAVALLEADGGDKDALAAAYNNLAISASRRGYADAAAASFNRALELRRETGNHEGMCAVLSNLANLLREQGKQTEAASQLEEARQLAQKDGNTRLERQVLLNLANLYENEFVDSESMGDESPKTNLEEKEDDHAEKDSEKDNRKSEGEGASQHSRQALRCRRLLHGLSEIQAVLPDRASECNGCGSSLRGQEKLLRCGRCRRAFFCSAECQRKSWPEHSPSCKAPSAPSAVELELRDRTCPICLDAMQLLMPLSGDRRVTVLQCLHIMHTGCWSEFSERGGEVCPVCRDSLGFTQ